MGEIPDDVFDVMHHETPEIHPRLLGQGGGRSEPAPLQPLEQIRDDYAAIADDDDISRFDETQERLRRALAEAGWTWPEAECWLPMRCPARGYCTQFLEGGQTEPCGWWADV